MTEQEIIDMAEKAGVSIRTHYDESGSTPQELLRFAKLLVDGTVLVMAQRAILQEKDASFTCGISLREVLEQIHKAGE